MTLKIIILQFNRVDDLNVVYLRIFKRLDALYSCDDIPIFVKNTKTRCEGLREVGD